MITGKLLFNCPKNLRAPPGFSIISLFLIYSEFPAYLVYAPAIPNPYFLAFDWWIVKGVIPNFLGNPNDPLMPICTWSCLIGTLAFGMAGRKTQGRFYANIALAILLSYTLLGLIGGLMFVIFHGILGYPT